jgi:riboflavin kinase/FMN adenylyltransferase
MRLHHHPRELSCHRRPIVLALGVFDGMHLGHQRVVREAVRQAREAGGDAGVLTFHPHPIKVLSPENAHPLLTTEQQSVEQLSNLDADLCVVMDFTLALSRWSGEHFLDQLLKFVPRLKTIVVGVGWRFGHERSGDFALLRRWAEGHALNVTETPTVSLDKEVVSSTTIRKLIARGDITGANARLGRPYQIIGRVARGDGLGRQLGFPTANLEVESELVPGRGVYAARALIEGEVFAAAVNIGTRPTFSNVTEIQVEAHLLDFEGNLYGHHLRLDFLGRVRDERRFASPHALISQIAKDINSAHRLAHL